MLIRMWYSGTTSSWVIGFRANDLLERSRSTSNRRSLIVWDWCTVYTSKWPCLVPTIRVSPVTQCINKQRHRWILNWLHRLKTREQTRGTASTEGHTGMRALTTCIHKRHDTLACTFQWHKTCYNYCSYFNNTASQNKHICVHQGSTLKNNVKIMHWFLKYFKDVFLKSMLTTLLLSWVDP